MMTPAIKAEEIYLSILCHNVVHPPNAHYGTGQDLKTTRSSQRIAHLLLKLLKVDTSARYPSLPELCSILLSQLGSELGGELINQISTILDGLNTPDALIVIMNGVWECVAPAQPDGPLPLSAQISQAQRELKAAYDHALRDTQVAQHAQHAMRAAGRAVAYSGLLRDPVSLYDYLTKQIEAVKQKGRGCVSESEVSEIVHSLQTEHAQGVLERESSVLPDAAPPTGPTASTAGAWPLSPLLARALELQLTQALARGDYSQALHPLHGFLDHAHACVSAGSAAPASSSTSVDTSDGSHTSTAARHAAALIARSALHTHFGHTQEAIEALTEALRAAQQANDPTAQLHALAALAHVTATATPGSPGVPADTVASLVDGGGALYTHKLLARCLSRAQELSCPHIAAFARLALSRWALRHTLSPSQPEDPSQQTSTAHTAARDSSGKGSDTQTGAAGGDAQSGGGNGGGVEDEGSGPIDAVVQAQESRAKVDKVALIAVLDSAAPRGLLGPPAPPAAAPNAPAVRSPVIAELYGSVPGLKLHGSAAGDARALADATLAHAGSARLLCAAAWQHAGCPVLSGAQALGYLACWGTHCSVEDTGCALAQVLDCVACIQGSLEAQHVADIASTALGTTASGGAAHRALSAAVARAEHNRACNARHFKLARRVEKQMQSLADPAGCLDADTELMATLTESEGARAAGDLVRARETAEWGFSRSRVVNNPGYAMRFLLQLGRVWSDAGCPTKAQQYLHSCIEHCKAANNDALMSEAALALTECWMALDTHTAPTLLAHKQDVWPQLLAHASVAVRARACWLLGELVLAKTQPEYITQTAPAAIAILDAAADSMRRCCMWEDAARALQIKAHVCDRAGMTAERDAAAQECLSLHKALQTQMGSSAFAVGPVRPQIAQPVFV